MEGIKGEDLVIGTKYYLDDSKNDIGEFLGINKRNSLSFKPISGNSYIKNTDGNIVFLNYGCKYFEVKSDESKEEIKKERVVKNHSLKEYCQ